jgi:hypothetical protein
MTSNKRIAVLALLAAAFATPALAQQTAGQVAGKAPSVAATPSGQHTPPTPEQRAARFDKADANKDGRLTKAEFTSALPAKAADRADKMWSRVNPTGKDSVTKAEYLAAPMGHHKADASGAKPAKPS